MAERGARAALAATVVTAVVGAGILSHGLAGPGWTSADAGRGEIVQLEWPTVAGATAVHITIGPEPPPTAQAPLPAAVQVASLPGSATRHRIEQLAPGVVVFARIAVDAPGGQRVFVRRARTAGGPRAALGGPARAVHLVAPDVLCVVVTGGDGEEWADGPWTVRREDGRPVRVEATHRRSLPVAQPDYEVGWRADHEPRAVIDHWLFLRLAEPLGQQATLRLEGPRGVTLWLPYSDLYLETPVVQLNQVGYAPQASRRWAYVSFWLGDGGPLALDRFPPRVEVLRGGGGLEPPVEVTTLPLAARTEADGDAGTEVRQIDLAKIPAGGGSLRIRVPGVGVSFPTRIDELGPFRAHWVTARGLFHNRWAGDLSPRYTDWPRPADHLRVYTSEWSDPFTDIPEDTPRTGERIVRGGHHDAGDFDIRPTHTAVARRLMRAYELAPRRHTDGQLILPESGNGIPDLLDEALWSVAAWEDLQESDGGVRGGVQSYRHPWGIYFAHDDPLPYWTFARDPRVTARAAALFAQASRLVEPFDIERAAQLRERAIRAYRWAAARRAGDAFLLYAESELLRTTGEDHFGRAFERRLRRLWPDRDRGFRGFASSSLALREYRDGSRVPADYVVAYLLSPLADPRVRAELTAELDRKADRAVSRVLDSPHAHRNPRPPGNALGWGQAAVPGKYLEAIHARLTLGGLDPARRQRMLDALSLSADYVLGANPLGMALLTGLGSRHPEEPLHLDSLVWIHRGREPVPGIPVFGPADALPGASYYDEGRRAFHPAFDEHPPGLRYADIRTFVVTNEFSVWETQAPQALLFAALIGDRLEPSGAWLPAGAAEERALARTDTE